jgi:hypothetical protein
VQYPILHYAQPMLLDRRRHGRPRQQDRRLTRIRELARHEQPDCACANHNNSHACVPPALDVDRSGYITASLSNAPAVSITKSCMLAAAPANSVE